MSAPRESFVLRHDVVVVLLALVVIGVGWAGSAYGLLPGVKRWSSGGVTFTYPADWLAVSSQADCTSGTPVAALPPSGPTHLPVARETIV